MLLYRRSVRTASPSRGVASGLQAPSLERGNGQRVPGWYQWAPASLMGGDATGELQALWVSTSGLWLTLVNFCLKGVPLEVGAAISSGWYPDSVWPLRVFRAPGMGLPF